MTLSYIVRDLRPLVVKNKKDWQRSESLSVFIVWGRSLGDGVSRCLCVVGRALWSSSSQPTHGQRKEDISEVFFSEIVKLAIRPRRPPNEMPIARGCKKQPWKSSAVDMFLSKRKEISMPRIHCAVTQAAPTRWSYDTRSTQLS